MAEAFCLFTAAAPYLNGGGGCNILSYRLLEDVGTDVPMVVMPWQSPQQALNRPEYISRYPEVSGLGLGRYAPRLRAGIDATLCYWLGRSLRRKVADLGVSRVFGFSGANWRFLLQLEGFSRGIGRPYDCYLVDDLESSLDMRATSTLKQHVCATERRVLQNARRVFAISPGYCEHLAGKYAVEARHVPFSVSPSERFWPHEGRTRVLVFFGSLNRLYISALVALAATIEMLHAESEQYRFKLRLVTLGQVPNELQKYIANGIVERVEGRTTEQLMQVTHDAWATILPYAFSPEEAIMVSTSFPTKLSDCARVGRPVLIFSPSYATTYRFASENGWRWLVSGSDELKTILSESTEEDARAEWVRQQQTFRLRLSSEAVRAALHT